MQISDVDGYVAYIQETLRDDLEPTDFDGLYTCYEFRDHIQLPTDGVVGIPLEPFASGPLPRAEIEGARWDKHSDPHEVTLPEVEQIRAWYLEEQVAYYHNCVESSSVAGFQRTAELHGILFRDSPSTTQASLTLEGGSATVVDSHPSSQSSQPRLRQGHVASVTLPATLPRFEGELDRDAATVAATAAVAPRRENWPLAHLQTGASVRFDRPAERSDCTSREDYKCSTGVPSTRIPLHSGIPPTVTADSARREAMLQHRDLGLASQGVTSGTTATSSHTGHPLSPAPPYRRDDYRPPVARPPGVAPTASSRRMASSDPRPVQGIPRSDTAATAQARRLTHIYGADTINQDQVATQGGGEPGTTFFHYNPDMFGHDDPSARQEASSPFTFADADHNSSSDQRLAPPDTIRADTLPRSARMAPPLGPPRGVAVVPRVPEDRAFTLLRETGDHLISLPPTTNAQHQMAAGLLAFVHPTAPTVGD
ncbi:hypothetical protein B484DRAFT_473828, partial [Ochromonadaceae sp. CCMP2298]